MIQTMKPKTTMNDFGLLLPISFCLLAKILLVKRPKDSKEPDSFVSYIRGVSLGIKTLLFDFYGLLKSKRLLKPKRAIMGCAQTLDGVSEHPGEGLADMSIFDGSEGRISYKDAAGASSPKTPAPAALGDDDELPDYCFDEAEERFIAILNKRSGGKKGAQLEECLVDLGIPCFDMLTFFGDSKDDAYRRLRNAIGLSSPTSPQSKTLDDNKEDSALSSTPLMNRVPIILVGGGDGSYAGAIQIVDTALEDFLNLKKPRVVPIPLGTGNDLSNALGWTPKCPNIPRDIPGLLDTVRNRTKFVTGLDRWNLKFNPIVDDSGSPPSNWSEPRIDTIMCYFSIGWDAKTASTFEKRREANPDAFTSQFRNNMVYTEIGLREMLSQSNVLSEKDFTLEVDGVEVEIPRGTRSVKVINIQSAQSGVDFWGSRNVGGANECKSRIKPACDDGMVELVSTKGIWHMLSSRLGMGHAQRLAQGKVIKLTLHQKVPIQADGEAWWQEPCTIEITQRDKVPVIVGPHNPRGDFSYSSCSALGQTL